MLQSQILRRREQFDFELYREKPDKHSRMGRAEDICNKTGNERFGWLKSVQCAWN